MPRPRLIKRPVTRSFVIDGDLWSKLAAQAEAEHLTSSDILRRIVREYFDKKAKKGGK